MSSLSGLSRQIVNYSDLITSRERIEASLSNLELLLENSESTLRINNEAIVKHILQQMLQVGRFREGSPEYEWIDEFSRRVLGIPASSYVIRDVVYTPG